MPSPLSALTIGALAEQAGCNVPTVRDCEEISLLPKGSASRKRSSALWRYDLKASTAE
jgi:hypothetical protein